MALRVLLADESSTIKKVMQLALQDFGVEVRSVPNGLDVSSVVKTFLPDIVFADVLLTKKSGYDVCADLKMDPATQDIPVVLMWSSFMELDQQRFIQSLANGRLEKPFDADALRSLVNNLVPKTSDNPLSAFLKFPKLPEFDEPRRSTSPEEDSLSQPEEFAQIPLYGSKKNLSEPGPESSEDGWSQQNLDKFKLQLPEEGATDIVPDLISPTPSKNSAGISEDTQTESIAVTGEFEEIDFSDPHEFSKTENTGATGKTEKTSPASNSYVDIGQTGNSVATGSATVSLSEERLLQEARTIIESICWKILPDITEKIVREELQKVMSSIDQNPNI